MKETHSMSRIQNILDKAEREGAVRRIRPLAGPTLPAVAVVDPPVTLSPPPTVVAPEPDGSVAAASAPMRVISGARLSPSLIAAVSPSGIAGEQYRALRTRIVHRETGGPVNVVLITSPGRGDGKSLTVANLGLAMAQEYQQRICVVDADFRSPQQHRLFGLPDAPGLSDVLTGRVSLEDALVALEDSIVLIVRAGITSKPAIHDAIAAVDAGKLLGIVLNEAA